jgi:SAM-dependent methyltransferase
MPYSRPVGLTISVLWWGIYFGCFGMWLGAACGALAEPLGAWLAERSRAKADWSDNCLQGPENAEIRHISHDQPERRSNVNSFARGGTFMTMPTINLVENTSIDRAAFEKFYTGQAPWDIDKPQAPFVAIADQVVGPILDAGCGTGEHALFFAARGLRVTGIDFVEEAIGRAKHKAVKRGVPLRLLVKDALTLSDWDQRFASVIDCGLFHVFSDDDRRRYVGGLAHVLDPGGRLFLLCFSAAEPGTEGPRRVSRQELDDAFADGWEIESVQPARCEVNPEFTEFTFSEGGPKVWFAVIRRN